MNQTAKAKMEKFEKNNEEADKAVFEQIKQILSAFLKLKMQTMRAMKKEVQRLESLEEEAYLASLVMPPTECSEKIHRAGAAFV